jgi:hypothetical protein
VAKASEPRERDDFAELTAMFELAIVDECHHIPAGAPDQSVEQIPNRRRLGPTAIRDRRDQRDDLIDQQLGPFTQTSAQRLHVPIAGGSRPRGAGQGIDVHKPASAAALTP